MSKGSGMRKNKLGTHVLADLTGAIVVVLAAGTAVAGYDSTPGDPVLSAAPSATAVESASTLVCDGGIARTIQGGINIENVDEEITGWAGAFGTPEATFAPGGAGSSQTFDGALPASAAGKSSLGVPELTGTLEVAGGIVAGASTHSASAGDLRAVAVNPCQWPTNTAWLVGGSSEVGSSLQLTVTNPGLTQVSIAVSAFSSRGELDLGANSMLHLAPGTSQTVLLDGLLPADPRIALRLFSDTGPFTASLQTSALDGVTPAGVDVVTNSDVGTHLVIPGLVIDSQPGSGEDATLPDPATTSALRIANPNEDSATVQISVVGEDGTSPLPGGSDVAVAGGSVLDLTLDGLAPGAYAIEVESSADISAAVSATRTDDAGRDVAWLAAHEPIADAGAAAIGPLEARLVLIGSSQATWSAYDESGERVSERDVRVDGVTTIEIPIEARFVVVSADTELYGSVWISSDDGIAAVPLTQDSSTSQAVTLTVQN